MTTIDAYLTPQDPEEITNIFFKIADGYTKSIADIKTKNGTLDDFNDSRIVAFTTMREVANSSLLSSIFYKDHLTSKQWWATNKNFKLPADSIDKYVQNRLYFYGVDLSTNFVMLTFTHFENSLRSIVRAIPSTTYPQATEAFWKLRNYLIDVSGINADYKTLLAIFQHIRNSTHNGGFHMLASETLNYKGKTFVFEQGKPITFDLWTSIEFIAFEVNNFLFDLMTSDTINNIPKIQHPFGTINFITKTS